MNNTQIIPVGQRRDYEYVDEPKEFAFFARSTEQRKREEAARIEADIRDRNRRKKAAREERRTLVRNFKLMALGVAATCCAYTAFFAWRASYPALAVFPAVLAVLAIWAGVRCK